jgi:hypothetical protein
LIIPLLPACPLLNDVHRLVRDREQVRIAAGERDLVADRIGLRAQVTAGSARRRIRMGPHRIETMPAQRLLDQVRMRQTMTGTLNAAGRHTMHSGVHRRSRTSVPESLHHMHDVLVSIPSLQLDEQVGTDVSGSGRGLRRAGVLRLTGRPVRWPGEASRWYRPGTGFSLTGRHQNLFSHATGSDDRRPFHA